MNVNLPDSAVQKATDEYVRELYQGREKSGSKPPSPSPASTAPPVAPPHPPRKGETGRTGLAFFESALADANDGTLRVNTARTVEIRKRLASRLDEVLLQKRQGVLGESNDGMLVVKNPGKLPKLLLRKMDRLVKDEDQDRKELYKEVVHSNGLDPSRLAGIQSSFARSFQSESPAGTWVQDPDGNWSRKR